MNFLTGVIVALVVTVLTLSTTLYFKNRTISKLSIELQVCKNSKAVTDANLVRLQKDRELADSNTEDVIEELSVIAQEGDNKIRQLNILYVAAKDRVGTCTSEKQVLTGKLRRATHLVKVTAAPVTSRSPPAARILTQERATSIVTFMEMTVPEEVVRIFKRPFRGNT